MSGFRSTYTTLQTVSLHNFSVIIMIGYQPITVQHIICTQSGCIGFLAIGTFSLRLLFLLRLSALTHYYRHNGSMYVRCGFVHVKNCGNGVLLSESLVQPLLLSSHHSSIRPSCCIFIMSSCVPDSITRIALTWSGVILRLMPADLMRWAIASSRSVTPLGSCTSSRLRCVRVGSTLDAITRRSMWSDIRASDAPFAFLKSRVKYPY